MNNRLAGLALLLALTPLLGGCCYMADWMGCYPDDLLVDTSWHTPEETLRTFQMSALHEDLDILYLCLSQRFKKRYDLTSLTAHLAWPKIQEEIPFLRSVFRAEVLARTSLPDPRGIPGPHNLILGAAGRKIQITMVPEPCLEILAIDKDDQGSLRSRTVLADDLPGGLGSLVKVKNGGIICLLNNPTWKEDIDEVDPMELSSIKIGIEWKIDQIKALK